MLTEIMRSSSPTITQTKLTCMKTLTRGGTVDFWSVQAWILTSKSYTHHVLWERTRTIMNLWLYARIISCINFSQEEQSIQLETKKASQRSQRTQRPKPASNHSLPYARQRSSHPRRPCQACRRLAPGSVHEEPLAGRYDVIPARHVGHQRRSLVKWQ